ncbi:glutathione synthase [Pajaroellobacter abortibovis]|uniref:Glutathione synthetase n=1 Tax=Pajaroellobacter abortibovis TaxID=1882918 RepID=A0A1L6MZ95_9BACT|nr:glutathione synthase [Pajaroellobacter abortibovis]APS00810.1 glutathione synthase [Pajaroellobacter abortibovis]
MKFLYLMDPMHQLNPECDTTLALQRASQQRAHECFHCLLQDIAVERGEAFAWMRRILPLSTTPPFELGTVEKVSLRHMDAFFLRKDPPVDSLFLHTTLLLEIMRNQLLFINDPRGLREANEKLYILHFPSLIPTTLVSSHTPHILEFLATVGGKAIAKPIDRAGGAGIMILQQKDPNTRSILEMLTQEGSKPIIVQQFIAEVSQGDKRILLLDGNILGAINRVPQQDDFRSNIHVGGRVEPCEVTLRERQIVDELAPRLRRDGLLLVGIDVIGGKLTEINVTSPTGLQQLSRHVGREVSIEVIQWVEEQVLMRSDFNEVGFIPC